MNTHSPDKSRETSRRISESQLTAAARVLQHWFERVRPAMLPVATDLEALDSDRLRAADAGGDD
jgi:hypothetical protein